MILERLNIENLDEFNEKKIVCYVKVPEYLKQIDKKYHLVNQVSFIVDEYTRRLGTFSCGDYKIDVLDVENLYSVDWKTTNLLITSEYFNEVFEKLSCDDVLSKKIDKVYYYADDDTLYYEEYLEKYKDDKLKDIIVLRSGPRDEATEFWMDYTENSKALFDYMVANNYNHRYELVWLVKDKTLYDDVSIPNVAFIAFGDSLSSNKEERDRYYYYICNAKYIFFTDAGSFTRLARKDQVRVQLWHGQGLKDRAIKSSFGKRCEYMPVMSQKYADIHSDIFGMNPEQILITGIPKQDWLWHKSSSEVLQELDIPDTSKYIFWLPTFRKSKQGLETLGSDTVKSEIGLPIFKNSIQLEAVNRLLQENNITLVIKLHPSQDKNTITDINYSNIRMIDNMQLAKKRVHINQLLGYADALISDYSSVAIDYLLLDRPLAFAVDDLEEYEQDRGFVLNPIREWLPGKVIFEYDEFLEFISEIANNIDSTKPKREKISSKLCIWKDDNNCKRLLERLHITI